MMEVRECIGGCGGTTLEGGVICNECAGELLERLKIAERDCTAWKERAAEEARRNLENGERRLKAERKYELAKARAGTLREERDSLRAQLAECEGRYLEPLTLEIRKSFLSLPMEWRRRIMGYQSDAAIAKEQLAECQERLKASTELLAIREEQLQQELAELAECQEALRQWECPTCLGTQRIAVFVPNQSYPHDQPCPDCATGLHPITEAALGLKKEADKDV